MHRKFWLGNLKGRDHSEDLGVDGRVILELILGKRSGRCGMDAYGSGYEPVADSCEHGNEPSGSIKDEVPLEQLSDSPVPKKGSLFS
jgi:hypothetical protein